MQIQFQCPACEQPIEVDSEWGGKSVTCPYCRKTVAAPTESTYRPPAEAPVARPASGPGPQPVYFDPIRGTPAELQPVAPPQSNQVAVWALVLSLSALACGLAGAMIIGSHWSEIEPIVEMSREGKPASEVNRAFIEQYNGAPPAWIVGFSVVILMAFLAWVGGVVCGLIGLRREPRRRFAIAGLAVSAMTLLQCMIGQVIGAG